MRRYSIAELMRWPTVVQQSTDRAWLETVNRDYGSTVPSFALHSGSMCVPVRGLAL